MSVHYLEAFRPLGLIVITILLTKLEATLSFHSGHYLVSSSR